MIAGYNTMSAEEKAKWDAKAMSTFIGWMLIIPGAILLVCCVPIWLGFYPIAVMYASWGIFTGVLIAGVIYMNVSSRFKRGG
jgi:hypothetical protein